MIQLEVRAKYCLALPAGGLRYLAGNSTPEHFGDCIERHCAVQHWKEALAGVPEEFRPRATEYLRERYAMLRQGRGEQRGGSFARPNR